MAHSKNFIDLTGQKMHRLTFLEFAGKNEGGNARWKVRCDCGTKFIADSNNIKKGSTRSCGCLRAELLRNRNKLKTSKHVTE